MPRRVLVAVALAALALFAIGYVASRGRPGAVSLNGYYDHPDQSNYRLEAWALRDGVLPGIDYDYRHNHPKPSFDPSKRPLYDYAYGLGYPALGVPSVLLGMRTDPFALPDAFLFSGIIVMVVVIGTRLRSLLFGLLTGAAIALATPLLIYTLTPWNTTITVVAVLVAIVVATDPRDRPVAHAVLLGAAIGMCFAARYTDAVYPAAIGGIGLLIRRPRAIRVVFGAALVSLLFVAPVLWSHAKVFGSPIDTPYKYHTRADAMSDQGLGAFDPGRAPRSFYEVFLHGAKSPGGEPMIGYFPWMVLAPLGLVVLVRERLRRSHALTIAAAISVVGSAIYLSFRAGTGADLQYNNLRYFMAWVPLWGILAAYGVAWAGDRFRLEAPV